MYIETSRRSLVKGITWRFLATSTTILIVYLFFGRLDLALAAGVLETTAKIFLYYLHERGWQKIQFGKKRVEPFNLWIIGLPLSGKKVLADKVFERLEGQLHIPLERIENREIRQILPEIGYQRDDRLMHIKRIGYLIKKLQRHSVSTIASFVSPYEASREAVKNMTENYVEVFVDMPADLYEERKKSGYVETIDEEQLMDLERVRHEYDRPSNPDIVIKEDESIDDAVDRIVTYVKQNLVKT